MQAESEGLGKGARFVIRLPAHGISSERGLAESADAWTAPEWPFAECA